MREEGGRRGCYLAGGRRMERLLEGSVGAAGRHPLLVGTSGSWPGSGGRPSRRGQWRREAVAAEQWRRDAVAAGQWKGRQRGGSGRGRQRRRWRRRRLATLAAARDEQGLFLEVVGWFLVRSGENRSKHFFTC